MKNLENLSSYDSDKALLRHLYTFENNVFKKAISDLGFHDPSLYSQLHNALYKGIYDPEEAYEKGDHVMENIRDDRDLHKSVTVADYMSPMELRMNAQGMFLAAMRIENARKQNNDTRQNLVKTCYWAGRIVRNEYRKFVNPAFFGTNQNPMNMTPVKASTLLKKLQTRLKRGQVPTSTFKPYKSAMLLQKQEELKKQYAEMFNEVKTKLQNLGFANNLDRRDLFKTLNAGFYQTNLSYKYDMEIMLLFKEENSSELISISDLKAGIQKLKLTSEYLNKLHNPSFDYLYKKLFTIGSTARGYILKDCGCAPETFAGFYNLYYKQYSRELIAEEEKLKTEKTSKEELVQKVNSKV